MPISPYWRVRPHALEELGSQTSAEVPSRAMYGELSKDKVLPTFDWIFRQGVIEFLNLGLW